MMADLTLDERINKLEQMAASGVKMSQYANGTKVEFHSLTELRAELTALKAERASLVSGGGLRTSRAVFLKD